MNEFIFIIGHLLTISSGFTHKDTTESLGVLHVTATVVIPNGICIGTKSLGTTPEHFFC